MMVDDTITNVQFKLITRQLQHRFLNSLDFVSILDEPGHEEDNVHQSAFEEDIVSVLQPAVQHVAQHSDQFPEAKVPEVPQALHVEVPVEVAAEPVIQAGVPTEVAAKDPLRMGEEFPHAEVPRDIL